MKKPMTTAEMFKHALTKKKGKAKDTKKPNPKQVSKGPMGAY